RRPQARPEASYRYIPDYITQAASHTIVAGAGLVVGGRYQLVQDPAFAAPVVAATLLAQRGELALEGLQARQAGPYPAQLCIDQAVDAGTIDVGSVDESQQAPDLVERHVEGPAVPDECKPFELRAPVC